MRKKYIYIILAVLSYAFLAYKLITFNYSMLQFSLNTSAYFYIICAVLLMPLNLLLEAQKWRYLIKPLHPLTLGQSMQHILLGMIGAFLTPAKIGDLPARVIPLNDKQTQLASIGLGLIGSLSLTLVITLLGLIATPIFIHSNLEQYTYLNIPFLIIFIVLIIITLSYRRIARYLIKKTYNGSIFHTTYTQLSQFTARRFTITSILNILRYFVFCLQFILLIFAFCQPLQTTLLNIVLATLTYYTLVTLTPSAPAIDPAVRSSWAIIVFSTLGITTPQITLTALSIWLINTIVPMLIGTIVWVTKK